MQAHSGEDAEGDAVAPARRDTRFTSETARAAALLRHRQARAASTPSDAPIDRDPDLVVEALWRKAQAGDVPASRELREWLKSEDGDRGRDDHWASISRVERDALLAALRAEGHPPAA